MPKYRNPQPVWQSKHFQSTFSSFFPTATYSAPSQPSMSPVRPCHSLIHTVRSPLLRTATTGRRSVSRRYLPSRESRRRGRTLGWYVLSWFFALLSNNPIPDAIAQMKTLVQRTKAHLSPEERNLVSVAYKNKTGSLRNSWRTIGPTTRRSCSRAQCQAPRFLGTSFARRDVRPQWLLSRGA